MTLPSHPGVAPSRSDPAPAGRQTGPGDALLIIDPQHDFLPGGALAVPGGDAIIEPLNRRITRFVAAGLPILATRDCHPPNHCSFREQGGPWPRHCVSGTAGARISAALRLPPTAIIIDKPCRRDIETYSAFSGTPLDATLREAGARRLWVGGLATDFCVRSTVLAALDLGYAVVLLVDAMRAVDAEPGAGARALATMIRRGATRHEE